MTCAASPTRKIAPVREALGDVGPRLPAHDVLDRDVDVGDAEAGADELDAARLVEVPDVGRPGRPGRPTECTTRKPERYGFSIAEEAGEARRCVTRTTLRLRPRSNGSTSAPEVDRHRLREHAAAGHRDPERLADRAARAVGGDEVAGAHRRGLRRSSRSRMTAVTPSASCSNSTSSVPKRTSAPSASARARSTGSSADLGDEEPLRRAHVAHAVVEIGHVPGELCARPSVSTDMIAPSGSNCAIRAVARPPSSMPAVRRISIERCRRTRRGDGWRCRRGARPRASALPWRPSSIAMVMPTRLPPTITTGTRESITSPAPLPRPTPAQRVQQPTGPRRRSRWRSATVRDVA